MAEIKQIVNGDDKHIRSGAIIELTSDELVVLSNALYSYLKTIKPTKAQCQLKDIIHIASQISQYGHMDNWAVSILSATVKDDRQAEQN